MMSTISAISKHLLFIALTWRLYTASDIMDGSGDGISSGAVIIDQIDPDFCVKLLALRPTQFFIYWLEPETDSYVSYYQVSYSVTVRYQTTAGQRIFNESHTSDPLLSDHSTFGIPIYNANSTYIVRVTAVTDDGDIITSDDVMISEDEFVDYDRVGQANAIKFFQLGLQLTDLSASLDCRSFEGDYNNTLSLTRSQLSQAVEDVCTSVQNDSAACATQFANDHFSCHNNNRLVYVARVVGTIRTNTTIFLEYLSMLGSVDISLHNQNFSIISSPWCPLSIPSPREFNCSPSLDINNTDNGNNNTIVDNTTVTMTTYTNQPSNDIVMVIVVALSCFVGIILMTFGIAGVMYICSRCNRYQSDAESIDLEGEKESYELKVSPRQLVDDSEMPTLPRGPGTPLSHPPVQYIVPITQQLKSSGISPNNSLPSSSHNNSHYGSYSSDNNLTTTSL